ncbi:hypothetical protein [Cellvibrio japonicus]|uniref:hypothetical protein n=1 Tax=Cellvibrio japonicus TaxID=155077 RepID=UPI001EE66EA8|nr:hypothetical protein [Cellvibrio japonicus]
MALDKRLFATSRNQPSNSPLPLLAVLVERRNPGDFNNENISKHKKCDCFNRMGSGLVYIGSERTNPNQ